MARYSGAKWDPLPEHGEEGPNNPRLFIVHIIVGSLAGAEAWFRRRDVHTESHFGLGKGHEDSPFEQWLDTNEEADTNWDANGISITVETAGMPDEPFTQFQIDKLIDLGVWSAKTHPEIKPQIANAWNGSGFGWHSQYYNWNKSSHTCPGKIRIRQLKEIVFPEIIEILEEGEEMAKVPKPSWVPDRVLEDLVRWGVDDKQPTREPYVIWRMLVFQHRTIKAMQAMIKDSGDTRSMDEIAADLARRLKNG